MTTRNERARRRRRHEEIIAWIMLPLIIVLMWLIGSEVYDVLKEPLSSIMKNIDRDI